MRLKECEGNKSDKVYMNRWEFNQFLKSYNKRRVLVPLKLMGRGGLRKGTASTVKRAQMHQATHPDHDHWYIRVRGKDSSESDSEKEKRDAWIPKSLKEEIDSWVEEKNIGPNTAIYPKSPHTLANDVDATAENAAERTGIQGFRHVTSHDLRRFYATDMLVRRGVNKEVVKYLGGWDYDRSIEPYIVANSDDIIADELGKAGLLEQEPGGRAVEKLREEVKQQRELLKQLVSRVTGPAQTGLGDFKSD